MATVIFGQEAQTYVRAEDPAFRLRETDETQPAGMWQIAVSGDDMVFQRATATDWSTFETVVTLTSTPSVVIHGTISFSGELKLDDDVALVFGTGSDFYEAYSATENEWELGSGSTVGSNVMLATNGSHVYVRTGSLYVDDGKIESEQINDSGRLYMRRTQSTILAGQALGSIRTYANDAGYDKSGYQPHRLDFYAVGDAAAANSPTGFLFECIPSGTTGTREEILKIRADSPTEFNMEFLQGVTISTDTGTLTLDGDDGLIMSNLGSDTGTALLLTGSDEVVKDSSSIAYKDNVKPLMTNTSRVFDLTPVSFNWKRDGSPDFGLIAEDVARTLPEMVTYNKDGEPQSVRYDRLSVFLLIELAKIKTKLEVAQQ